MLNLLNKFKESKFANTGTIIGLASLVIMLLTVNGVTVDSERVMLTIRIVCSIGIYLGVLNNSETEGLDLPFTNKE